MWCIVYKQKRVDAGASERQARERNCWWLRAILVCRVPSRRGTSVDGGLHLPMSCVGVAGVQGGVRTCWASERRVSGGGRGGYKGRVMLTGGGARACAAGMARMRAAWSVDEKERWLGV